MSKSAMRFLPLLGPAKSRMSHECQILNHWELCDVAASETLHNKARSVLVVRILDNAIIAITTQSHASSSSTSPCSRSNLTAWSSRVPHDSLYAQCLSLLQFHWSGDSLRNRDKTGVTSKCPSSSRGSVTEVHIRDSKGQQNGHYARKMSRVTHDRS